MTITRSESVEVFEAICHAADTASNEWHAFATALREDRGGGPECGRAKTASDRVEGILRALLDTQSSWEDETFDSTFRVQPSQAVRGLHEANVTTVGELRERLEAGTLGDINGVGPAAVLSVRDGLGWVDRKYAEAREHLANLVGGGDV